MNTIYSEYGIIEKFTNKQKNHSIKITQNASINLMSKLHSLEFEMIPHPLYFPYSVINGYLLFADIKNNFRTKIFARMKTMS